MKVRIVRHATLRAPLTAHLAYLRRDGVARSAGQSALFDADGDRTDHRALARRCRNDRHHFRIIVSPEDAGQLSDLRGFTRELMKRAGTDLGTGLDWVAADHWNTAQPHVHILLRGKDEHGADLVIDRDYITQGLRARVRILATEELGPRSEIDMARALTRDTDARRWTRIDAAMKAEFERSGSIDLYDGQRSERALLRLARLRTLKQLGLARDIGGGVWQLSPDVEQVLRTLRRGPTIT